MSVGKSADRARDFCLAVAVRRFDILARHAPQLAFFYIGRIDFIS